MNALTVLEELPEAFWTRDWAAVGKLDAEESRTRWASNCCTID